MFPQPHRRSEKNVRRRGALPYPVKEKARRTRAEGACARPLRLCWRKVGLAEEKERIGPFPRSFQAGQEATRCIGRGARR